MWTYLDERFRNK